MRLAPVDRASLARSSLTLHADRLLHPHAGPAGAAAHALGAVARHLDDLDALDRADDLARREVHVVVAAEVARVVVRDALLERRLADVEPPVGDQLLEQLGVVDDLVVAAELRVLVEQRVEAVRALGDDLAHAHAVEHLDVRHRQHLEQVLVAGAAGRVAGAHLRRPEHGDGDPGPPQQLGHRLGDPLVLVVEAAGAADPVEVLGLQRLAGVDDLRRRRGPWPSRRGRSGSCPTGCPGSPCRGRRCRARSGSPTPSATGSAACRGSCRGSRCSPGRSRRTPCTSCRPRAPPT